MSKPVSSSRLLCGFMAAMLCAGVAGAQSQTAGEHARAGGSPDEFGGLDYTVTTISATSFTSDQTYVTDPGSLFRHFAGATTSGHYYATVNVPAGAVIDFIGLESAYVLAGSLTATLFYADRYSGTTFAVVSVDSTAHPPGAMYFNSDYNSTARGFQLIRNVHNELVIDVYRNGSVTSSGWFGWVEIWWKRAVSPAPANATFSDVPPSSPQFKFVEALHAAGITAGCGGGNYCPDSPVTRGQMAVFLATALGLHWPY